MNRHLDHVLLLSPKLQAPLGIADQSPMLDILALRKGTSKTAKLAKAMAVYRLSGERFASMQDR